MSATPTTPIESSSPIAETPAASTTSSKPESAAWAIDFGTGKKKYKASKKEKKAIETNRGEGTPSSAPSTPTDGIGLQVPEETPVSGGNGDEVGQVSGKQSQLVSLNGLIDLEVAVPRNLTTTKADMAGPTGMRNHFDVGRWNSMVRQYKASCGVSSLTSVWNSLYSQIGSGNLPPVSQEEIMTIIGFQPPFETIRWGPFTGNVTLMRWFHMINTHFGVKGKAYYQYKAHGQGRTMGKTPERAKKELKEALLNPSRAVIYHCYNHYMVPIGFQESPLAQVDCYAKDLKESDSETWILIGEVSRGKHPPMHVKKWKDIATDIECGSPNYFNIRHSEDGVKKREKVPKKPGGNLHCLIAFRSDMVEDNMDQFNGQVEEEDEEQDDVDQGDDKDEVSTLAKKKRKSSSTGTPIA